MPGFVYFLPNQTAWSEKIARAAGLDYLLGISLETTHNAGPNSGPGLHVYAPVDKEHFGGPDRRKLKVEWRDCGAFWLGWKTGEPPEMLDLLRGDIGGKSVEFFHNQDSWPLPGLGCVDRVMAHNGSGWSERVKRNQLDLVQRIGALLDAFLSGEDAGAMPDGERMDLCIAGLQLLYRVGPHEVSAMELLDSGTQFQVLTSLFDYPATGKDMEQLKAKRREIATLAGEVCDGPED